MTLIAINSFNLKKCLFNLNYESQNPHYEQVRKRDMGAYDCALVSYCCVDDLRISMGSFHWKTECWIYQNEHMLMVLQVKWSELLTDTHIYTLSSFVICCYSITPRLLFLSPSETCSIALLASLSHYLLGSHYPHLSVCHLFHHHTLSFTVKK